MLVGNGQIIGAREVQEDYFAHFEIDDLQVLIVADGIGGRDHGEVASELAVSHVARCLRESALTDKASVKQAVLKQAAEEANAAIAAEGNGSYEEGMGTTLVVALVSKSSIVWLSIGDSLLYRLRDGELQQLNALHTQGAMLDQLVISGEMSAEDAAADEDRDGITSALMGMPIPMIDCREAQHLPNDRYLVASDGILTIQHVDLTSVMGAESDPQLIVDDLLARVAAFNYSTQDNCTLLVGVEPQPKTSKRLVIAASVLILLALLALSGYFYWLHQSTDEEPTDGPENPDVILPIEETGDKDPENTDDPDVPGKQPETVPDTAPEDSQEKHPEGAPENVPDAEPELNPNPEPEPDPELEPKPEPELEIDQGSEEKLDNEPNVVPDNSQSVDGRESDQTVDGEPDPQEEANPALQPDPLDEEAMDKESGTDKETPTDQTPTDSAPSGDAATEEAIPDEQTKGVPQSDTPSDQSGQSVDQQDRIIQKPVEGGADENPGAIGVPVEIPESVPKNGIKSDGSVNADEGKNP